MFDYQYVGVDVKKLHEFADKETFIAPLDHVFDEKPTFKADERIGNHTNHIYMRKWDEMRKQTPLSKVNLVKQSQTLWKKTRKKDSSVHFQYALEKNHYGNTYYYHLHYIVHHSDFGNIANNFKRHIGHHQDTATFYTNSFGQQYARIYGDWGYMDFHNVYDYRGLCKYLDKSTEGLRYIQETDQY
jgi:hypothetical protein